MNTKDIPRIRNQILRGFNPIVVNHVSTAVIHKVQPIVHCDIQQVILVYTDFYKTRPPLTGHQSTSNSMIKWLYQRSHHSTQLVYFI